MAAIKNSATQSAEADFAMSCPRLAVAGREAGTQTPEELETLFEDALLVRDGQALAALFEEGAVLGVGNAQCIRGRASIAVFALTLWDADQSYVADPRHVMQTRDIALIVAERGINVARRGSDGAWRYAIALVSLDPPASAT